MAPRSNRMLPAHKEDIYAQHGHLLHTLHDAPSSLERLLAVGQFGVSFLADLLKRSNDTQDIPLLLLGHHYISHRVLSKANTSAEADQPPAALQPAGVTPPTAPAAGTAPAADTASGGDVFRAYVQEVCSFDAAEGPKSFIDMQGVPQAICALQLEPVAIAKAKRLGRDLSIKVNLQPSATNSTGSVVRVLECGEDYSISWPSLLFLDPISTACSLAYKGDLDISCSQTGLSLSLSFAKNHTVKGVIEQQLKTSTHHQAVQAAPTAAAGASSSAGAGAASDAVGIGSSGGGSGSVMGGAAAAAGVLKPHIIGSLEGSWLGGTITVTCPDMGLEGVMYDGKALNPAPAPSVDLRHMGPMRLSRFWSAVHDALLYADPRAATGGRSAVKLASTMSHYLTALTLDSAAARDIGGLPAASTAAHNTAGSKTGLSSKTAPSVVSAATDPDIDEFDRQAEGRQDSSRSDALQDTRAVPPCYKEQHARGNKLRYQLHYTLTRSP